MEKSLSLRIAYSPRLMLDMLDAALDLDYLSNGRKTDLKGANKILGLLYETYNEFVGKESLAEMDFVSEWNSALTVRLIPEIYGITRDMPYKKEHFEAGLYFILEQFKDLENADSVRAEFARNTIVNFSKALLKERNLWWRNTSGRYCAA